MALTLFTAARLFRTGARGNWPLAYWGAALAYTFGFSRGLNAWWVGAGVLCALAVRCGPYPRAVRWAELAALGYVLWRALGLILLW